MKASIIYLAFLCVLAPNAQAQQSNNNIKKTSFYAGPQVSVAAGSLAKTHTWGVGVNTQVVHQVSPANSVVGRVNYMYMFGKNISYGYYEPGGGSNNHHFKTKGMSDVSVTGGVRHNFPHNLFGGIDAGLCVDFWDGSSDASYDAQLELGYLCNGSPLVQAFSAFFGICGDPKLQIGLRYAIRL